MATPHPKPTALRVLEGKRAHRPLPKGEPQPLVGTPKTPDLVLSNKVALAKWEALVGVLGAVPGWITHDMVSMLERYALIYAQMVRCEDYLVVNGETFEYESETVHKEGKDNEFLTKSKGRRRHPESVVLKECRIELRMLEMEMGMGPVYRAKVDLSGSEPDEYDLDV